MEYGEYWILETAVEAGVYFYFVDGSPSPLQSQWNKPWHGLKRAELLDVLERLQGAGDIEVLDESYQRIVLSRDDFNRELEYPEKPPAAKMYQLTSQGGARWEVFTRADWNRFHSYELHDTDDESTGVLEIAAATAEIAERAFKYSIPWNDLVIDETSVSRQVFEPWQATYWKKLRVGHGVRCKCVDMMTNHYLSEDLARRGYSEMEIKRFYHQMRSELEYFQSWYTPHPACRRLSTLLPSSDAGQNDG